MIVEIFSWPYDKLHTQTYTYPLPSSSLDTINYPNIMILLNPTRVNRYLRAMGFTITIHLMLPELVIYKRPKKRKPHIQVLKGLTRRNTHYLYLQVTLHTFFFLSLLSNAHSFIISSNQIQLAHVGKRNHLHHVWSFVITSIFIV